MSSTAIANGQYNIGHICTRMQCDLGRGSWLPMRFITPTMQRLDYTFGDLEQESNKFANALRGLGFRPGDTFFTFLPKRPECFFAILGSLKLQVITGTLFSNFGEEAILDRLGDSNAKGVITKKSFLKKIAKIRDRMPSLKWIVVTDIDNDMAPDILSYQRLVESASTSFDVPQTAQDTPSLLHYTSGSTGKPKGVLHVHRSVILQSQTARNVLSLTPEDLYWCTADQGWVTGTSYGIIGPWSLGVGQVHFAGSYEADRWFDILEQDRVTIWYSAPTALRMLMREDPSLFERYNLQHLKHIFSVGEPLNPEVIRWARKVLKHDIYDTWFQTETGSISIANHPGLEVRPGSMGKPVEGIEPAILADDGTPVAPEEQGNLCLKPNWPSMFVSYLNADTVYQAKFKFGYYWTGDKAWMDQDGYYWFAGRSDDIINTAGHLVSPFEVESALLEVPEIAESGVIAAPDDLLFEKVVAFVLLRDTYLPSPELELKIRVHVSNKVSSVASPQEIFFVDAIPKNKSGKILRRVLKARYLGIDPGDTSTMEA
jgi:acetyl-CoA synthetase